MPFISVYLKGLGLGAGLIVAIGSQNAYVLKMGLRRQHVGLTVLVCIVCEILLIGAGVAGMGSLIEDSPILLQLARWGGALFLAWYGLRAWRAACSPHSLNPSTDTGMQISTTEAVSAVLIVTLLNPHVYLDTVVLLGSIAGQHGTEGRWWFALGAMSGAVIWFTMLGFGARLLSRWFVRPAAWRILDGIIGAVMIGLAISLVAASLS